MNRKADFSNIKALIFDYGGTLDTNARHWAHVLWEGYRHAGVPVTEEQFREAYVCGERTLAARRIILPGDDFRDLLLKKVDIELRALFPGEDNREWTERVVDYCMAYIEPIIAVSRSVLRRLQGRYKLVLVSNFYGNIGTILRAFRLDVFDSVVESAVVGVRKPDPAIYRLGVEATGEQAADVLVVGDAYDKDMVPASLAGCKTVWLKGEGWKPQAVDETLPDAVIDDLPQLLGLLPGNAGEQAGNGGELA